MVYVLNNALDKVGPLLLAVYLENTRGYVVSAGALPFQDCGMASFCLWAGMSCPLQFLYLLPA